MSGYYHEHYDTGQYPYDPGYGSSSGIVAIVVIIIILIIIGLAFFFFFRNPSGGSSTAPLYTFNTTSTATGTDTFAANNFTVYTNSPTAPLTLTLTAPTTSTIGSSFIIDNSAGTAAITIASGVTVSNNITYNGGTSASSNVISPRTVAGFIWKSSTSLLREY